MTPIVFEQGSPWLPLLAATLHKDCIYTPLHPPNAALRLEYGRDTSDSSDAWDALHTWDSCCMPKRCTSDTWDKSHH